MPLDQIIEATGISSDYWSVWNSLMLISLEVLEAKNDEDRQAALDDAREIIPRRLSQHSLHQFQTYSSFCVGNNGKAPITERVRQLDADSQTLIDYLKDHQPNGDYDFRHIINALNPIYSGILGFVDKGLLIE